MPYGDFAFREDIYGIISKTLSEYYDETVRVVEKGEKTDPSNTMYCFRRIGIIIPGKACPAIVNQVKREYRITYSLTRKFAMNAYITCVFLMPWLFCDKKLSFPSGIVNGEMFIEPGNKKIKIIDYKKKSIINIVKKGFKADWIKKEIAFRTEHKKDYLIQLKCISGGYEENLHTGYGFPRLTKREREHLQSQVNKILENYSLLSKEESKEEYLYNLVQEIKSFLSNCNDVCTSDLVLLINKIYSKVSSCVIPLCLSHGDLQQGNLFYDVQEKKVYLIDWETWDMRSVWYDRFLYYYGFRNSTKIVSNIATYFSDSGKMVLGENADQYQQITALLVFILEDLKWQIDEMKVLPNRVMSNGLREYIKKENLKQISELVDEVNK